MNELKKKKVALIEDDPDVRSIIQQVLKPYAQDLEVVEATNAGEAMDLLFPDSPDEHLDAVILDLMMTYGKAAEELDETSDPHQVDTGVRILKRLRKAEKDGEIRYGSQPLWVSIITARNEPHLIQRVKELLGSRGRIYLKPFNDLVLEHDLALVLGLDSQVDPDLLPTGYSPPMQADGGTG
jgi:CheY-like chemotaxis protein